MLLSEAKQLLKKNGYRIVEDTDDLENATKKIDIDEIIAIMESYDWKFDKKQKTKDGIDLTFHKFFEECGKDCEVSFTPYIDGHLKAINFETPFMDGNEWFEDWEEVPDFLQEEILNNL